MDSENQIRNGKHEDHEHDNDEKYNPKYHMPHMYPGQMHCPYMNMCSCPFMQGKMYNPMDMDMEDEDMRQRPRPQYYHRPRPHYYPRPHIRPYFYPFLFPYYYDEYDHDHDHYDEWDEY